MRFTTESGSTYDVESTSDGRTLVRRCTGLPTEMTPLGDWREAVQVQWSGIGCPLVIVWPDPPKSFGTNRGTTTSPVVRAVDSSFGMN